MTIHKEGRTLLSAMLIVLIGLNWLLSAYVPEQETLQSVAIGVSLTIYLLVLQFFRNPTFTVPRNDKHILAPADGKVVVIEETDEPEHLKGRRRQISIFMSPLNVHVNRMPAGGFISYFKYHPGKYLVAWHPKSSTENERTTVAVKLGSGTEILFRQIAGAVARRIKWYVKPGDALKQGDEFGFIKFGSRVDVFLPLDSKVTVNVGDVTRGGRTVIAELP